jgi:hypothetical protein
LSITSDAKDFGDVPTLLNSMLGSSSTEIQENVVASIQSLLDPEISLLPIPGLTSILVMDCEAREALLKGKAQYG